MRTVMFLVKTKPSARRNGAVTNDELLIGVASMMSCAVCPGEVTLRDQDCMKEHFIERHLDDGKCLLFLSKRNS